MEAIYHSTRKSHSNSHKPYIQIWACMAGINRKGFVPSGGFLYRSENRQSIANKVLGLVCRIRQKIDKVLGVFHKSVSRLVSGEGIESTPFSFPHAAYLKQHQPLPSPDEQVQMKSSSLLRELLSRVKRLEAIYYGSTDKESHDLQIAQIKADILRTYGKRNQSQNKF